MVNEVKEALKLLCLPAPGIRVNDYDENKCTIEFKAKKLDPLTTLVIQYQDSPNDVAFFKIYNSTKRLVWQVIVNFGLIRWPVNVLDDIEEDCRSFILIKALAKFDRTKSVKFSTYYTLWCMSQVRMRRNYYRIRPDMVKPAMSINDNSRLKDIGLDNLVPEEGISATFSTLRVLQEMKQTINQIFYGKSYYIKVPFCFDEAAEEVVNGEGNLQSSSKVS